MPERKDTYQYKEKRKDQTASDLNQYPHNLKASKFCPSALQATTLASGDAQYAVAGSR